MILVTFYCSDSSVKVGCRPFGFIGQSNIWTVPHTMRFDVGFIDQVKSVLITEFIPSFWLRIVTRSDCIDVVAFHGQDIQAHGLFAYHMSGNIVMFMQINSFQVYRNSVDPKLFIANLDVSESDIPANGLQHSTLLVHE